jgi:hypothetical protein
MKKLNYLFCLFVFALPILNINIASASSGACSYHGGVNCSAGADIDGSIICADGWTDSSVSYSSMSECRSSSKCPMYLSQADYDKQKQEIQNSIDKVKSDNQTMCQGFLNSNESRNEQSYQICVKSRQSMMNMAGSVSAGLYANTNDCEDTKTKQSEYNKTKYNSCLYNSQDTIFKYQTLLSCLAVDHTDYSPVITCPKNSTLGADKKCTCNTGYVVDGNQCTSADNPFAHILSDALKNTNSEPVAPKKKDTFDYRITSSIDELNSSTSTKKTTVKKEAKAKKSEIKPVVVATTTISTTTTTTTPVKAVIATTTPTVRHQEKTKWYSSFFSRFFSN